MRKSLASALLAATLPALVLSACNSQAGGNGAVSALPNAAGPAAARTRISPDDFSKNDLHAGGATFPAYGYNLGSQPAGCALTGCSSTSPGATPALPQAPPGTGSLFAAAGTQGSIYYCLTGSGAGRAVFEGPANAKYLPAYAPCAPLGASATGFGARQDPPDFAGSDVAMPSTEYAFYKTSREPASGKNWGEMFEFPVIGGPIVYGYRPHDFAKTFPGKTIRLSTWTYCAIANGTISDWNDPAITADNGGSVTKGKSEPITFYFRSDGSGTSYNFVYHLNYACKSTWKKPYNADPYQDVAKSRNAAWTYGPPPSSDTWPGPGSAAVPNSRFVGENGNPGVLAAIQSTPFSTGYLEGAWAKSANPAVSQTIMQTAYNQKPQFADPTNAAQVEKAFAHITASSITYGGGSDELPLATTRPECVLYIDAAKLQKAPTGAYPMIAVSYLMFYGHNNGFHTAEKKKLINFMVSKKATDIESSLEYIPLNASILTAVKNALDGGSANGGKKPCLQ